MNALYEFMSAVWAAARYRVQRHRQLPAPTPMHRPGSTCAHLAPARRSGPPAVLRLAPSDAQPGYCWLCGQTPCGCLTDGGDAA